MRATDDERRRGRQADGRVVRPQPTLTVGSPDGAWRIPRIWVAMHGIPRASQIVALAEENRWEKLP